MRYAAIMQYVRQRWSALSKTQRSAVLRSETAHGVETVARAAPNADDCDRPRPGECVKGCESVDKNEETQTLDPAREHPEEVLPRLRALRSSATACMVQRNTQDETNQTPRKGNQSPGRANKAILVLVLVIFFWRRFLSGLSPKTCRCHPPRDRAFSGYALSHAQTHVAKHFLPTFKGRSLRVRRHSPKANSTNARSACSGTKCWRSKRNRSLSISARSAWC